MQAADVRSRERRRGFEIGAGTDVKGSGLGMGWGLADVAAADVDGNGFPVDGVRRKDSRTSGGVPAS